jgi:hypothetical protein
VSGIAIEIPPRGADPFAFRRAFLGAIRKAIGDAQISGELDAETAVECFKALPPPAPDAA